MQRLQVTQLEKLFWASDYVWYMRQSCSHRPASASECITFYKWARWPAFREDYGREGPITAATNSWGVVLLAPKDVSFPVVSGSHRGNF